MPANPTPEELAALRVLCEKATAGEVSLEEPIRSLGDEQKYTWVRPVVGTSGRMLVADAEYMVVAWNNLPRLIDALEAERAIVKKWNCEMSKVLAGSEYINEPAAYVRAFQAKSDTIKEQAIEIRTERTARESAEKELGEAERWETGFRNIVYRLIGSRTEFEIPQIVEMVSALERERDEARNGLMVSEQYRREYCTGKYKLFAYGGEICEAAAEHLPSGSEGPLERYAHKIEREHSPLLVEHNARLVENLKAKDAELAEARGAARILTESGVRGHEAVCALAKERDGLAAQIAAVNSLVGLEQDGAIASDRLANEISVVIEDAPLVALTAHDARLTAPLERRVKEFQDALQKIKAHCVGDKIPNWRDGNATYWSRGIIADIVDAALASTPREGTEEPNS